MRKAGGRTPSTLRSVLVATDFSPGAVRALERASQLPLAEGSRLVVLHVLPRLPRELAGDASRQAKEALAEAVRTTSAQLQKRGSQVEVKGIVSVGDAAEETVLASRNEDAELVVLGRHSHRRVRDLFLGSTAHRVVRTAGLPVLVVSGDPSTPYRRPMAAVDLEVMSRGTLELLSRVLGAGSRTVAVVHAFEVSTEAIAFPGFDVNKLTRWGEKFRREAAAGLQNLLRWLPDLGVQWSPSVRAGSTSAVILAEAERQKADLLAVGTHGKGPISRMLLGSTAERVLAGSRCDVLVARPNRIVRAAPTGPRPKASRASGR